MGRWTIFLDTNLFLHYKFFEEVDWRECTSSEDVVLALCPAMTAELDKKKFAAETPKLRERAKRVIRRLMELDPQQPVHFREGCWVWYTARNPEIDFVGKNLSRDIPDHVILASALEYAHEDGDVALVSADFGMRMNAKNRGLVALAPPDEWLLADEPDERDRELRELKRQLAAVQAASPDLRLTVAGKNFIEFEVKARDALSPTEIERKVAAQRKRHPYLRKEERSVEAPMRIAYQSALDVDDFNGELKEYFDEYEDYLKALPSIYERSDKTVALDLTLENVGTQAAEDIDVIVTAGADGCWRAKKPEPSVKMRRAPELPTRGSWDILSPAALQSLTMPPSQQPVPRANAIARMLDDAAPKRARFHVNLVKPQLPVVLPTRYFEFASFDSARSFTLAYQLIAPSSRESRNGEIHIRVTNK
jgi:hypothetical protein